jgi:hypothetical protein
LTKQNPDEIVKCHLSLEDASKVSVTGVLDDEVLGMHGARVRPKKIGKPKVNAVAAVARKSELGKAMSELYDIESSVESEKRLKIELDVDLYQMEKV